MSGQTPGAGIDWGAIGRGGSRAVGKPTLVIVVVAAVVIAALLAATLPLSGVGAWIVRVAALALAVPVVMLAVRRHQVLQRLHRMEETGEHPDNVVRTVTPDGQQLEVIVGGAEQTVVPRLGVGGLAALSFASIGSAGMSFGLLLIVGLAQLF
ncbi:hypothetical protein [Litorihabitans aurantiacus]|uniref:Uncharacterized protein n=1 Tax=Litorihabitans aurantiacus TaxID=1930061 RepID=A0AA37XD32_9MICO|nr:hypothetical protein [Litorihabitans aurantiacus]GMA30946.1 hypothetical protein GCM10025875_09380 [Litorihabitans aurantiacus]